jgi:hypothetical protein
MDFIGAICLGELHHCSTWLAPDTPALQSISDGDADSDCGVT